MKVVAYSVQSVEKEYFAKANKKKHDITLIANPLEMDTIHYAEGKEAVIMPEFIVPLKAVTDQLWGMGIKYIITRRTSENEDDLQEIAEQVIKDLDEANNDDLDLPVAGTA